MLCSQLEWLNLVINDRHSRNIEKAKTKKSWANTSKQHCRLIHWGKAHPFCLEISFQLVVTCACKARHGTAIGTQNPVLILLRLPLPLFVRQTAPAPALPLPHVPKQTDPSFLETWNEKVWVFFGIWVSGPEQTDRHVLRDSLLLLLPPCFYIAKCNKRECCCIWLSGPGFQDLDKWTLGFSTSTDARTQQAKLYIRFNLKLTTCN